MAKFKNDLSVIVLTFNEQKHIKRCLESITEISEKIYIVDSGSSDDTIQIAESFGVNICHNKWVNYANQLNWAIQNLPIETQWIMRIDCDEYLTKDLIYEINDKLKFVETDVNGLYIKRRVIFLDKWIRYGGYYPIWLLRIWRNNTGVCEEQWMDEHIKLSHGNTLKLKNDLVDHNLNDLSWWTNKHNNYATREMIDLLNMKYNFVSTNTVYPKLFGKQEERKKWFKLKFVKQPLFFRPILYFIYRYIFLFGFMDGQKGFIWHFLQGLWYRFLVDAKIFEAYCKAGHNKEKLRKFLIKKYKVKF